MSKALVLDILKFIIKAGVGFSFMIFGLLFLYYGAKTAAKAPNGVGMFGSWPTFFIIGAFITGCGVLVFALEINREIKIKRIELRKEQLRCSNQFLKQSENELPIDLKDKEKRD